MTTLEPAAPITGAASRPRITARVIGLDLSLRRTGVASCRGWATHIAPGRRTGVARLRYIRAALRDYLTSADLAVMEGAAYSRALQRGHEELAALRWWAADVADLAGVPLALAPPSSVKVYGTGRGRMPGKGSARRKAEKAAMGAAAEALYPGVHVGGDDEADALILAAMGADWLGYPTTTVPDHHRAALAGVAWPCLEVPR